MKSASLFHRRFVFHLLQRAQFFFFPFCFQNVRWHQSCSLLHSAGRSPAILHLVWIPPPTPITSWPTFLHPSRLCSKCELRELKSFFFPIFRASAESIAASVIKTCRSATVGVKRGGPFIFSRSLRSPCPARPRLASVRDAVTDCCLLEQPAIYHRRLSPVTPGKSWLLLQESLRSEASPPPTHTHTQ